MQYNGVIITRRSLLRFTGGAVAVGAVGLLASCATSSAPAAPPKAVPAATSPPTPQPTAAAAPTATAPAAATRAPAVAATGSASKVGAVQLPTYAPVVGAKADLPGSGDGVIDDGFTSYPRNPFKSVSQTPGDGSDITLLTWVGGPPPASLDQNPGWQAVNKEVGANLKMNMTPFPDYLGTKLSTTIAGGDLPDVLVTIADPSLQLFPEFFEAACSDLTPYLAGDAIKAYPNLAALPTRAWKRAIWNGKIFGVPNPLRPFVWWFWAHQDVLDQAGVSSISSSADLQRAMGLVNKPQQGIWAIGSEAGSQYTYGVGMGLMSAIFKSPNNWAVDTNGKFKASFEDEQYKAAVGFTRELFAAGYYHPDSSGYNTLSARTAFQSRKFVFRYDALVNWSQFPAIDPPQKIQMVPPFAFDGSKPSYFYGRPNIGIAALKKATPERVQMLLRVLNYFAAPFGSQEYLLMNYGVPDVEHTLDDKGNPNLTEKGKADVVPFWTVAQPKPVLYDTVDASFAATQQDNERKLLAAGVDDPTIGLYSRTYVSKWGTLNTNFGDGVNDIIAGRRPLSDYDGLVQDWRKAGGDQIRTEYEQDYAATRG